MILNAISLCLDECLDFVLHGEFVVSPGALPTRNNNPQANEWNSKDLSSGFWGDTGSDHQTDLFLRLPVVRQYYGRGFREPERSFEYS